MSLDKLSKLVEDGETEESEAMARELLAGGTDPLEILDKLTQTMQRVGDLFANLDIFLPEVMLAGEALTAVVDIVKPELKTLDRVLVKGKVVIGVVKGDLHEIGKNIVKLMLETGFQEPSEANGKLVRAKVSSVQLSSYFAGHSAIEEILAEYKAKLGPDFSYKVFNERLGDRDDAVVLVVSADLPFAQGRFCQAEGTADVKTLSMMRSRGFAKDYGMLIEDGPLAGITARAALVLDADNKVVHSQLVREIGDEPDYDAALAAVKEDIGSPPHMSLATSLCILEFHCPGQIWATIFRPSGWLNRKPTNSRPNF